MNEYLIENGQGFNPVASTVRTGLTQNVLIILLRSCFERAARCLTDVKYALIRQPEFAKTLCKRVRRGLAAIEFQLWNSGNPSV